MNVYVKTCKKNGKDYLYTLKKENGCWKQIFLTYIEKIKNGGKVKSDESR